MARRVLLIRDIVRCVIVIVTVIEMMRVNLKSGDIDTFYKKNSFRRSGTFRGLELSVV